MMPDNFLDGVVINDDIKPITVLAGDHFFLDNFYEQPFDVYDKDFQGICWNDVPTVEHAFQAHKTVDLETRYDMMYADTPGEAKAMGQDVLLREDWNRIKFDLMCRLVWEKFDQHERLRLAMIETGYRRIIEGNTWDDNIWGEDPVGGGGKNWLGNILMRVRHDIRLRHKL